MAVMDAQAPKAVRGLPGATVLHIIPALTETPAARAEVDPRSRCCARARGVIVAAEERPAPWRNCRG